VGETDGGFRTPVAAAPAGNVTIETPMRTWPPEGTVNEGVASIRSDECEAANGREEESSTRR